MAIKGFEKKDPYAGLNQLLQMMSQMSQIQDRKKNNISSSLKNILDLSRYATNEDSLANIKNSLQSQQSNASQYEETSVYYDLIGNVLNDRGAQINQYSSVVDEAAKKVNSADFLRNEKDFENLPEWVRSQVDDEGKQKYSSVMQWVADEYAQIETYANTIESGSKLGFKRGKGIDDSNIQTQIGQYKNRLDATLEALIGDETITAEEAQLIISGDRDTFIKQRDTKVRNITAGIEQYDDIIQNFDNEAVLKKLVEDIPGFEDFDFGTSTKSEREAVLKTFITERDKGVDNYKRWMGSDYEAAYKTSSQLEEASFIKAAGEGKFDDKGEFQFGQDEQEEELERFEKLSLEEQKAEIEKKKKIGQERYETVGKIEEGIKEGLIDPETKKEFSSGEKLVVSYIKGSLSEKELLETLKEAGADWNTNLYFMKKNKLPTKENLNYAMRDDIKLLDEWLDIKESDAGLALNDYLKDDINFSQAARKAHSKDIEGRKKTSPGRIKSRTINAFKSKFKNSGLSLEEFIKQNEIEYKYVARLLKYAYYMKTSASGKTISSTLSKF